MGSWNIQDSVKYISQHAEPKSIGKCARYVRTAMEAGGLSTDGRPGSAYQYKGFLPKLGFTAIGDIHGKDAQRNWTNSKAQVGDISVMEHGEHGHICMWNGSKWVSDFAQNNMWPYKGDGTCTIFRYGGKVDGSLTPYNGEIGSGGSGGSGRKMTSDTFSKKESGGVENEFLEYNCKRSNQKDHKLMETFSFLQKQVLALILEGEGVICTNQNHFRNMSFFEDAFFKNHDGNLDTLRIESFFDRYKLDINSGVNYNKGLSISEYSAAMALTEVQIQIDDLGVLGDMGDIGSVVCNVSAGEAGISPEMLNVICEHETGHKFGYTIKEKELAGYDLGDANGHRTFGYGLLYHPETQKFMDTVKPRWSQSELESLFLTTAKKFSATVDKWANKNNIQLNQNQKDAIVSGVYNFGPGFLNKSVCKLIAANPNDPKIKSTWEHMSDSQGQKYPGLIKRRKHEAAWYFGAQ